MCKAVLAGLLLAPHAAAPCRTFVLVAVVYAVAIGEPSFGNVGPLVVGLALFTMVFAGSQYTGDTCALGKTPGSLLR